MIKNVYEKINCAATPVLRYVEEPGQARKPGSSEYLDSTELIEVGVRRAGKPNASHARPKCSSFLSIVASMAVVLLTGCTVHPAGESAERQTALRAGNPFAKPLKERDIPPLPQNPTADDLVHHALLANAALEQKYWLWRSAIEQIPQDGTQPTMIRFFGGTNITRGNVSLANTTVGAGSGTTANFIWPGKLSAAARRAMERARAAGEQFRQAQFDLRKQVLDAYYDYALTAEDLRLEQANAQLLQMTVTDAQTRNRAGMGSQLDLLKSRNELDLSNNKIAQMQARLPAQGAAINALLDRDSDASLPVPSRLPITRPINYSDEQLITLAARYNPELAALTHELRAGNHSLELARLQYYPNFAISVSTDLSGITQNLMGGFVLPLLRYQALNAAIAQAQANLKSIDAMRRQTGHNLSARIITDIEFIHDADRQINLFKYAILPRAQEVVTLGQSAYETGGGSLLDVLDDQRSLIAIERLVSNLRIAREKSLADMETVTTVDLSKSPLSTRKWR